MENQELNWNLFRHNQTPPYHSYTDILAFDRADQITDASKLPHDLPDFLEQFQAILMRTGLVEGTAASPPVTSNAQIVTFFALPIIHVSESAEPIFEQNRKIPSCNAGNVKRCNEIEIAVSPAIKPNGPKLPPEEMPFLANLMKKIKALF